MTEEAQEQNWTASGPLSRNRVDDLVCRYFKREVTRVGYATDNYRSQGRVNPAFGISLFPTLPDWQIDVRFERRVFFKHVKRSVSENIIGISVAPVGKILQTKIMGEAVVDNIGVGPKLQLFQNPSAVGTDCLNAQ